MKHTKRFTEGKLDNQAIIEELGISDGQTIMDVGCGNGYMSMLFAKEVAPSGLVYAIDVNELFINELREENTSEVLKSMVGDISHTMPVPSGVVDVVYVSTVVHSLSQERLSRLVDEVSRLLAPGGLLGVVEIAKHNTPFGPPLSQRYSPEELQALFPLTPVKTRPVAEHFYLQVFRAA